MSFVVWSHCFFFFFNQKTAYEMRISDWSSDVCSSDLLNRGDPGELLTDLIGEKKAKALLSSWGEKMPEHAAHAMLAELGVGPEIRKKIIATIPDFEAV